MIGNQRLKTELKFAKLKERLLLIVQVKMSKLPIIRMLSNYNIHHPL